MTTELKKTNNLRRERWNTLVNLQKWMDGPMNILAFIWLLLTVVELTKGIGKFLTYVTVVIWIIFAISFIVEFILAPRKTTYLKHNWLTALSLLVPALRVFKILRALRYVRFVRGTYLIKVLSSTNRGMRATRKLLGRHGFSYVLGLTVIVVVLSSAGIMVFEKETTDYFSNFGTALWWSSMMVTTMGADYFPKTPEGRLLGLLLAVYGFAIFGYLTATVSSFFVTKDGGEAALPAQILSQEIIELRLEIKELKLLIISSKTDSGSTMKG